MAGGLRKESGHEMCGSIQTIIETLKKSKRGTLKKYAETVFWVYQLYFSRCNICWSSRKAELIL